MDMSVNDIRYNQLENENDYEYGLRLIDIKCTENPKDLDWQDIVELLDLNIHRDSLRKACSTTEFSSFNVKKYYEKKIEEIVGSKTPNVELEEIEEKIQELTKEKYKMQDQKREIRGLLRTQARWEHLMDVMKMEIEKLNNSKPLISENIVPTTGTSIGSLLLSDFHVGMEIDSLLNTYNLKVFRNRMDDLRDKVIYYSNINDIKLLNTEILGDLIHGLIHLSAKIYSEEDVISQTMHCAETLAHFISNLSKKIPEIVVHFSVGNHGRTTANYKEHIDVENFEYIILWYLKDRLSKLKNVSFSENVVDNEIIHYTVFDKHICAVHGHKDSANNPNGVKHNLTKLIGHEVDEVHMGHYHNFMTKGDILVNGCLSGVDQYAISKRYYNKPSQVLKIYHENGDELIHNIVL